MMIQNSWEPHLRVLGSRHAFSDVADTTGMLIDTGNMHTIEIDTENMMVSVGAGVTYATLIEALKEEKVALANLPGDHH